MLAVDANTGNGFLLVNIYVEKFSIESLSVPSDKTADKNITIIHK